MVKKSKISTALSTRMILDVIPLLPKFTVGDILENVILSLYQTDSSSIISDSSIIREYADSVGITFSK
jgi:hypothetical protein